MAFSLLKIQARQLRKEGHSIREISNIVGCAKSTVSVWCRDIALNEQQMGALLKKDREGMRKGQLIIAEMRRKERWDRVQRFQLEAFQDLKDFPLSSLFACNIGLYWGEGAKSARRVMLSNSDPYILKAFIIFLKLILKKSKNDIFARIQLNATHAHRYPDVLRYWSTTLLLPPSAFGTPSFIKTKQSKVYPHPEKYFGLVQLTLKKGTNNSYLVMGYLNAVKYWIDQYWVRVAQW